MELTREAKKRFELLEELISIPKSFGFSIPDMMVVEQLTHCGKDYHFYFNKRTSAFLTMEYDAFQHEIKKSLMSKDIRLELEVDKERFDRVIAGLEQRILEKNMTTPSLRNAEYEGFLAKTAELTTATQKLAEEIAVLENKEEVKQTLHRIEEQIRLLQTTIEEQKEQKLQSILATIQVEMKKENDLKKTTS